MSRPDWDGRFWSKVDKTGACWLWTFHKDRLGYGRFWLEGISRLAHVVAYKLQNGEVTDGLHVLHRCDVRNCVRGSHLFIGTHADNMEDAARKGRFNAQLSPAQMEEVIRLTAVRSRKDLADRFSVDSSCIRDVQRGRTGRYLRRAGQ